MLTMTMKMLKKEPSMDAEEINAANELLGAATPEEVLKWAVRRFHPHLLMATAFGAEGCCLIDMLAGIEPGVKLINLDTGYQFLETLALRDAIAAKYGMEAELVRPEETVSQYEKRNLGPVYQLDPDRCCADRKIAPLKAAMALYRPRAWISAIRKDQTHNRATAADVVQWDFKFGLVKVNPLLNWTKKDVWKRIVERGVPYNDLHDRGYPSIGCWPCTHAVRPGEDDRAGRWAGRAKTECGLHVIEETGGSGI